ncbi:SHOCT domain-containing protein [Streptomyces sp. NPDC056488]|uniref:SHOCT domain-containing protein n=1 Tax=unclassified Streptomyces TaxID=2593676 RepID=UPI00368BAB72
MYLAYGFPLLSAFWSMLWFFLWILWFILLFRIITDIFRDHDMNGWAKAGRLAFVVLLPFLGILVYVIARGKDMGRREIAQERAQQQEFDSYIRKTASGSPRSASVDELTRLSELRSKGDITDEEFRRAKSLILADSPAAATSQPSPTAADR